MESKMDWNGKSLAEDLAATRDQEHWMTWVQIPLGSVVEHYGKIPVADVIAVRKSFANPTFIIYEVKVSRSDFNADVNNGKYRKYFEDCHQLFFAVPSGLVSQKEIPEDTGLIVRSENSWHVIKAAPRRELKLSEELLLKLLMRGYEDRLIQWKQYDRLKNLEYKGLKEASLQYGIKIAQDLSNASELIEQANKIKDELEKLLGEKYDTVLNAVFRLRSDVDTLLAQRRYAKETLELVQVVDRLLQGTRFFANGTPGQLRKIADKLEATFQKEEGKSK